MANQYLTSADFDRASKLWLEEEYTAGMIAKALECDVSDIYEFLVVLSCVAPRAPGSSARQSP